MKSYRHSPSHRASLTVLVLLLVILNAGYSREEPQDTKKDIKKHIEEVQREHQHLIKEKRSKLSGEVQRDLEFEMEEFQEEMERLHEELEDMTDGLPYAIGDLVDIPPVAVFIPDIPAPMIEIDPEFFEDMDFDIGDFLPDIEFYGPMGFTQKDLTDEEQLRIATLRGLRKMNPDRAVTAIDKVLKDDSSPAVRMEALRLLNRFRDHKDALALLGEVARNDTDLRVRRTAVKMLGNSTDPRAADYLEALLK